MEKYFVCAIKSAKDSRIYVGMINDPKRRLREHNGRRTSSIKAYRS